MNKHDWNQSELARRSGLSRQVISYYLSDKSKSPDIDALKSIARALKLPISFIFEEIGILPAQKEMSPERRKLLYLSEGIDEADIELINVCADVSNAHRHASPVDNWRL